jgi:hypothetical protein
VSTAKLGGRPVSLAVEPLELVIDDLASFSV